MKRGDNAQVGKAHRREVRRGSVLRLEERGRQVTRHLNILRALENSRLGLSVKELEELDLGCSQRTVYRALEQLQTAGFHIQEEGGRYRVDGKTLLSDALRPSQVLALLVATELMMPLRGLAVEQELAQLFDSLRARLTPKGRMWVEALRSAVMANRFGTLAHLDPSTVKNVEDAMLFEQLLEIEYAAPNKPVELRTVEPHLLWCRDARPYLVAFCLKAKAFRNFALQRIRSARMLDDIFEPRTDFNSEAYVNQAFGSYHGPVHQVTVRFEKEVAHLAEERIWHASQTTQRLDNGVVLLSMTVGGLPEIAAWLAGFGGKAQALDPQELRERTRKLHQAGLEAHAEDFSRELSSGDKGEV